MGGTCPPVVTPLFWSQLGVLESFQVPKIPPAPRLHPATEKRYLFLNGINCGKLIFSMEIFKSLPSPPPGEAPFPLSYAYSTVGPNCLYLSWSYYQ